MEFNYVSQLIEGSSDYKNNIWWTDGMVIIEPSDQEVRSFHWTYEDGKYSIQNCTDSDQASDVIYSFAAQSGLSADMIFGLSNFMLSLISAASKPKMIADCTRNFDGIWDFSIQVEDYLTLKKKTPASVPKRSKTNQDHVEFEDRKTSYIFGFEYNPKSNLRKLRYKLYPQKSWWNYRWDVRYRSFEDLAKIICKHLPQYYVEEEISESMKALIKHAEKQEQLRLEQQAQQEHQERLKLEQQKQFLHNIMLNQDCVDSMHADSSPPEDSDLDTMISSNYDPLEDLNY